MTTTHTHETHGHKAPSTHSGSQGNTPPSGQLAISPPEIFQDIFQPIPADASPDQQAQIAADNARHDKVYRAIRYLLIHDFGFTSSVPVSPQDFPSGLNDLQRANFAAIYGLMLADNYDDPMMGKDRPTGDDIVATDEASTPVLIARKFADEVVAAVQEYTARANLFQQVFRFLKSEGTVPTLPPINYARTAGAPV